MCGGEYRYYYYLLRGRFALFRVVPYWPGVSPVICKCEQICALGVPGRAAGVNVFGAFRMFGNVSKLRVYNYHNITDVLRSTGLRWSVETTRRPPLARSLVDMIRFYVDEPPCFGGLNIHRPRRLLPAITRSAGSLFLYG